MNLSVYKSSAGSGKTYTLVKEYLALALSDTNTPPKKYSSILAITFTNKAAAEMKDRIIKMLNSISNNNTSHTELIKDLCGRLKISPEELSQRAANNLKAILHNYSDFAVSTIDSFIHRIIRTFAFDLRLSSDFTIETDSESSISSAIDLLIGKIGKNEQLTNALVGFCESKIDDEKNWHIENDLLVFAKQMLTDEGALHAQKLKHLSTEQVLEFRKALYSTIRKYEEDIKNVASRADDIIKKNKIPVDAFYQKGKGIYNYFKKILKDPSLTEANSNVLKTITENKWVSNEADEAEKISIYQISEQLVTAFNNIQEIAERSSKKYHLYQLILKNIYSIAVLNEIEKAIEEYKNRHNIIFIDEFNRIISDIITSEPVPFIYERIGDRYKHYLVDEFQDTSLIQWQNLIPLIENSISEGNFNMLVGDGKQAIYRWRGGEVEQFSELPKIPFQKHLPFANEKENVLTFNYQEKKLAKNYRSKKEIIQFNNLLFEELSKLLASKKHQNIYLDHQQEFDDHNIGGSVTIDFIEKEDHKGQNAKKVHEYVLQLLSEGFEARDIAIITRNNLQGSAIAEWLTLNSIPVVSNESLLLVTSEEVNLITSVLSYLSNPDDPVIKAEIIKYICFKKKIAFENEIQSATQQDISTFLFQKGYLFNINELAKYPLYELCEEICRIFELNQKADPYVLYFMNQTLTFSNNKSNLIDQFLEWWNSKKNSLSISMPDSLNAVRIMTIHASKGLEFPAVIIPFADWRTKKGKDNLWLDIKENDIAGLNTVIIPLTSTLESTNYTNTYSEEISKALLDNINLLYVAFTRPSHRLYVISTVPSKKPENLNNIADLLATALNYIQQQPETSTQFKFGNAGKFIPKKQHTDLNIELSKNISNKWHSKIKIKSQYSGWMNDEYTVQKDFGIALHDIMARIIHQEDTNGIINTFLNKGIIDFETSKKIKANIYSLFEDELFNSFFSKESIIKTEAEIIGPNNEIMRPDRVVINGSTATVIDYKTGKQKDDHKIQMNNYALALSKMGYDSIKKYIVYTDEKKIVELQ